MKIYYLAVFILFMLCLLVGLNGRPLPSGYRTLIFNSDSMSPTISPGSLILIHQQTDYQPGDIISFWTQINNQPELVTHRIIKLGGNLYVTKGDNNPKDDYIPVLPRLIVGKTIFFVPFLGQIVEFFRTRLGLSIIMLPISLVLYREFRFLSRQLMLK